MKNRTRRVIVGVVSGCAWAASAIGALIILASIVSDSELPYRWVRIVIGCVGVGCGVAQLWKGESHYDR